jgi:hypothetical protein
MWRWKEYDPQAAEFSAEVVGRIITKADIHGVFASDVIINPGEAVVYIRDGKIEDVMTQTRLKDVGGGFFNWVNNKLDRGEDVQLLFLDTAPFDLEFPVDATSKDYIKMQGKQVVRVQLSTDGAPKLINLMNRTRYYIDKAKEKNFFMGLFRNDVTRINRVLFKSVVQSMLTDEVGATVLTSEVSKVNAADFRGNMDVQRQIETTATLELQKTFEMWGFQVIKCFTVWGKNAYDAMMEQHRQYALGVEKWDLDQETQHQGNLARMRREYEDKRKIQEQNWDYQMGDLMGQEGLKTAAVKEDLHRGDLTVDAQQGQQTRTTQGDVTRSGMVADERYRQTTKINDEDIRVMRAKGMTQADIDRAVRQNEVDMDRQELEMAMKAKDQLHQQKMQETQQDQDFKTKQMDMQTSSTEKIMSKALDSGAADSAALREMMRQQTMQKMADRESDKVKSTADSDAARYNMDTYERSQDRDREYQLRMAGQSADLMQASKPNVPHTLVQGGNGTATVLHPDAAPPGGGPVVPVSTATCPSCGAAVQQRWKACPGCGEKLSFAAPKTVTCPGCGNPVKAGWKACPECGQKM